MVEKETSKEFDTWKRLWGSVGVWFGDPSLGFRIVLAMAVIFSFVDWVAVYEVFYGGFSYDSVVNFSRIDKIQKYSYLYEENAVAFSSLMTTSFMYIFYPVFFVAAIYFGVKNSLPRRSFTVKRILSIPLFFMYSIAIVYWVAGYGFEGPARFFGGNVFINKYFIIYDTLYFFIMYISIWLCFLSVWLLVGAIKVYLFGRYLGE